MQEMELQTRKKEEIIMSQDGVWGILKWNEGDFQNDIVQHALEAME